MMASTQFNRHNQGTSWFILNWTRGVFSRQAASRFSPAHRFPLTASRIHFPIDFSITIYHVLKKKRDWRSELFKE